MDNLSKSVAQFVKDREWSKYHTPKNLVMSIAIEAAELMENYQWADTEDLQAVTEEVADVVIYCIALCNVLGIDLEQAVLEKIAKNGIKYPVEKFKGSWNGRH